jgi:hypothetical protein
MVIRDSGESFTPAQLDAIKTELNDRLKGVQQNTDKWWEIAKAFLNDLAKG